MPDGSEVIGTATTTAAPAAAAAGGLPLAYIAAAVIAIVLVVGGGFVYLSMPKGTSTLTTTIAGNPTTVSGNGNPTTVNNNQNSPTTSIVPVTTVSLQSLNNTLANATAELKALGAGCNLKGVSKIVTTYTNQPGVSQTLYLSNSNVTRSVYASPGQNNQVTNYTGQLAQAGATVTAAICAAGGASSNWASLAQSVGGNTNGQWFTATYNGTTGYYNLNTTNPNYITLESRVPLTTFNHTALNAVFLERMVILKRTDSLAALSTFSIPGTNPLTSESFQTVMNNANSTANLQIEYNEGIAYDPALRSLYGGFGKFLNLTTMETGGHQTSSIGWTNETYTFS